MASTAGEKCDEATEVLALSEYLSKYEFLKEIEPREAQTHIDFNENVYPIRLRRTVTKRHGTVQYTMEQAQDITVTSDPVMSYVTMIWETEEVIWFKTHGAHGLKLGSVVRLDQIFQKLQGYHVVGDVNRELHSTGGNTLFTLVDSHSKLSSIPRQSNGVLWVYGEGMKPGECICQFMAQENETDYVRVTKTALQRALNLSSVQQPLEMPHQTQTWKNGEPGNDPATLNETDQTTESSTLSPNVLDWIEKAATTATKEVNIEGDTTNETFKQEQIFDGLQSVQPVADSNDPTLESRMLTTLYHAESPQSRTPRVREPGPRTERERECECGELSRSGEILSDSDSSDDADSVVEESVPFSAEELNVRELECAEPVIDTIVHSFSRLISDSLVEIGAILHPLLLNDHDGSRFARGVGEVFQERMPRALMQKGEIVCLVPQRLYGALYRCLQHLKVDYQFYGGVLLHLLEMLDRIYREQHFHLIRYRIESVATNPLDTRHNSQRPELSVFPNTHHRQIYFSCFVDCSLSVGTRTSALSPPQMPHLASIIEQPDISSVTDEQLKALFRNAPYLMKNQISNPKFLSKMEEYVGQRASGPLRRYQELCVERFQTGENYVIVAPTGAGKTKIFVECSRKLLEKKKEATIVVMCPSVALATQQACVYVVEGFLAQGYWVNTFSSGNQLKPEAWHYMTSCHNVMVLTPQLLLNVMDFYKEVKDYSIFKEIDLLIVDECHHVRKGHAYSKIINAHYEQTHCKTQVLGFTASPTRSPGVEEGEENLKQLLDQMQAKCISLSDENIEVCQHVPAAIEQTAYCEGREEDSAFSQSIGHLLYNAHDRYISPLVGKVRGICRLSEQSFPDMHAGLTSSHFENWAKQTVETLDGCHTLAYGQNSDLISSIELLRACNNSLDLVNDAGFESALKVLAKSIREIRSQLIVKEGDGTERMFPKVLAGLYCSRMIQSIGPVLQAFSMSPYPSEYSKFPRFVQLVQFLERYKDQEELHGIVFVKTRDGVYHLAKMLRMTPSLRDTSVLEFTGHGQGNKKKCQRPVSMAAETLRGMSGAKCDHPTAARTASSGRYLAVDSKRYWIISAAPGGRFSVLRVQLKKASILQTVNLLSGIVSPIQVYKECSRAEGLE